MKASVHIKPMNPTQRESRLSRLFITASVVIWLALLIYIGLAATRDHGLWLLFGFMVVFGLPISARGLWNTIGPIYEWYERRSQP